jgi:hypothetical protein
VKTSAFIFWGFIVVLVVVLIANHGSGSESSTPSNAPFSASTPGLDPGSFDATAPQSSQPDAPADPPVKQFSRLQQKRQFLKTVDESVSGARIAGNPYKFVGTNVDLHCVVTEIFDEDATNANCGEDANGYSVNVVIVINTKGLEKGQSLRVIGTVEAPMEGTNGYGGDAHFPTVKAEFAE